MGAFDAGSMCCCGDETYTVFGPRWTGTKWDQYNAEIEQSPAHLLGTVYYSKTNIFETATTRGLYTITDDLNASENNHSAVGDSPPVTATVTTWDNNTLYVVNDYGAVQKVSLPDAKSKWWVSPYDAPLEGSHTKNSGFVNTAISALNEPKDYDPFNDANPGAFYWYPKFVPGRKRESFSEAFNTISTFGRAAVSFVGEWFELGLGLPTGPNMDSECGSCLDDNEDCKENPRGEFVRGGHGVYRVLAATAPTAATSEGTMYPWKHYPHNLPGYSGTEILLVAPWKDDSPKDQRKEGGKSLVESAKQTTPIETLSSVVVDSSGDATVFKPGDEIQWGWGPDSCATGKCSALQGVPAEVMTDLDFCYTNGYTKPAKILPQKVAANGSPYAAGGYSSVTPSSLSAEVTVDILAVVRWEDVPDYELSNKYDSSENECVLERTSDDAAQYILDNFAPKTAVGKDGSSFTAFGKGKIEAYLLDRGSADIYVPFGYWSITRTIGVYEIAYKTHLVTGKVKSEPNKLPYISTAVGDTNEKVILDTKYYWKPSGASLPEVFLMTKDKAQSSNKADFPWGYLENFDTEAIASDLAYMQRDWVGGYVGTSGNYLDHWGFDNTVPTKEGTRMTCRGHVQKGAIYYYNRTENCEVSVVSVEEAWEGLQGPHFNNMSASPRTAPSLEGSVSFTASGTTPSCGWTEYEVASTLHPTPAEAEGGTYQTRRGGTYELGRWGLDNQKKWGQSKYGSDPSQGAHYTHSQLLFDGTVVWDETKSTTWFTQQMDDDTNAPLNTHVPGAAVAYSKVRGFPAILLDSVEVLTGDRIAVLTHDVQFNVTTKEYSEGPQVLTVFAKEDGIIKKKWSIESIPTSLEPPALICSSSDRWVHVSRFPLFAKDNTDDQVPSAGQDVVDLDIGLPRGVFTSWLFSIDDGSIRVPARIDEPFRVEIIHDKGHSADATSSWADWNRKTYAETYRGSNNYDSPRSSAVIDTVKPGTMHPAEFF